MYSFVKVRLCTEMDDEVFPLISIYDNRPVRCEVQRQYIPDYKSQIGLQRQR